MDETVNTGGSSWESWIQSVAGSVIGKASDASYVRPYDIQELRLRALGDLGVYQEGQAGTYRPATAGGMTTGTMIMLAVAAVAAVMLLKD